MEDFGAVQVFTGTELQNENPAPRAETALANIEQSRAVAEVQASIVLAKANPRNEIASYSRIMKACKRKSLAERASYSFKRGGSLVTGPTIRLAEVLAGAWGNIHYGFREIGRKDDFSEVEAFAHDLETNTRAIRQFQVRHYRDTRGGAKAVTAERDKYELVASMAQRRVRSCLLEIIPGDIVDAAEEACKATLMKDIGDIKEKGEAIIKAFGELGVTKEMIENYLDRKIESIVPADVVSLQGIYRSIRDGIAPASDFFAAVNHPEKTTGQDEKTTGELSPAALALIDQIDQLESVDAVDKWRSGAANRKKIDALGAEAEKVYQYADTAHQALMVSGDGRTNK